MARSRRGLLRVAVGAAVAAVAARAVAQPGPGAGMMGGGGPGMMGGGPGMMGGEWDSASYLAALKDKLAITPAEEPAWKEYAATFSGVQEQMRGVHQSMYAAMGTASWQERRDMMNNMFQARQAAAATMRAAAEKLVASLAPAQQTQARAILPGLAYGRGPGMGRGGPMGPRPPG